MILSKLGYFGRDRNSKESGGFSRGLCPGFFDAGVSLGRAGKFSLHNFFGLLAMERVKL